MSEPTVTKGLLIVYTGDGKGKTTAALGQALRAIGHGLQVLVIQFMKGDKNYGEVKAARDHLPALTIEQWGRTSFVSKERPEDEDIELAQQALARGVELAQTGDYDMVILDEVNVAVDFNLVTVEEVLQALDQFPENTHVVLTGRYAPPSFLERADLVSEVREVKHHYSAGIQAQPGIEF